MVALIKTKRFGLLHCPTDLDASRLPEVRSDGVIEICRHIAHVHKQGVRRDFNVIEEHGHRCMVTVPERKVLPNTRVD